jgi:hypothetical protein
MLFLCGGGGGYIRLLSLGRKEKEKRDLKQEGERGKVE